MDFMYFFVCDKYDDEIQWFSKQLYDTSVEIIKRIHEIYKCKQLLHKNSASSYTFFHKELFTLFHCHWFGWLYMHETFFFVQWLKAIQYQLCWRKKNAEHKNFSHQQLWAKALLLQLLMKHWCFTLYEYVLCSLHNFLHSLE